MYTHWIIVSAIISCTAANFSHGWVAGSQVLQQKRRISAYGNSGCLIVILNIEYATMNTEYDTDLAHNELKTHLGIHHITTDKSCPSPKKKK